MKKSQSSSIPALKDKETFINELVKAFPEIKEDILDEDIVGLQGLQIGYLTRFTQQAIDKNDLNTVARCFKFAEANIDAVEFAIQNSLAISYLGKLAIPVGSITEQLLPANLKIIRDQLSKYYDSLAKDEKVNEFLKSINKRASNQD